MGGVDDEGDVVVEQPARETIRASESADAHLALGQARARNAPCQRRDHRHAVARERGCELARLARAAQHQDAGLGHGAAGRSREAE